MVNGRLSTSNEMRLNSLLNIFNRRTTSTNTIKLRSYDQRGDGGAGAGAGSGEQATSRTSRDDSGNVRRSRSQSRRMRPLPDARDMDDVPQPESIYEDIHFDDDTSGKSTTMLL